MNRPQEEFEKMALRLPPRERMRLADKLWKSVESAADPDAQAAWEREIGKRVRRHRAGQGRYVSAQQDLKTLKKKYL